jgi:hypothetical protein
MAECAPCPCDPVCATARHPTLHCMRGFGYVQIMLDKVVEFWLLRAAPAAAQ